MGERGDFVDKAGSANGCFGSEADPQNGLEGGPIRNLAELLLSATSGHFTGLVAPTGT